MYGVKYGNKWMDEDKEMERKTDRKKSLKNFYSYAFAAASTAISLQALLTNAWFDQWILMTLAAATFMLLWLRKA